MATPSDTPLDTFEMEDAKEALRDWRRKVRSHRGEKQAVVAGDLLCDNVMALDVATSATCVSIYASRAGEPATEPLIAAFAARGADILIPRLGTGLQRGWGAFSTLDDLIERAPGRPPEPSGDFLDADVLERADLVIVPALSVDQNGARLGQGGGWYDRALKHARSDATFVALVYDDEIADESLPTEEHDVPVHAVVTPSGVTWFTA